MKKIVSSFIVCVLALLLFVIANILVAWGSGFWGWDVTSEKNYTLSRAAEVMIKKSDETVTMRLYVSENLSSYDWSMGEFASQVVGVLNRYRLLNDDKIKIEIYRVKSGSAFEKQAVKDGIIPLSDGENDFYFGLKAVAQSGKYAVIPSFNPARKNELENDINRVFFLVSEPQTVVGIVSPKLPWWAQTKQNPFKALSALLKEYYTVAKVGIDDPIISQDIDVLLVIYPVELPKVFAYALDQYVMRGGKVIFVVDPYSELMHKKQGYPPRPDEKIAGYLKHWGVDYVWDNVSGNIKDSEKITDAKVRNFIYPLWFFAKDKNDKRLHFRTAGEVKPAIGTDYQIQSTVDSGAEGGTIPVANIRYAPKSQVMSEYVQDDTPRSLILTVSGKLRSHFSENILSATDSEDNVQPYMPFAVNDTKVAVIADSDFLADETWVFSFDENNPVYGTTTYADNAAFLVEMIDEMNGLSVPSVQKNKLKNTNIAEWLYTRSFLKYADEKDKAEREEAFAGAHLNRLRQIKSNSEDIVFRKKLDEAEQRYVAKEKKLKQVNAQIKADADGALTQMLLISLLFGPVIILLLSAVAVQLRRMRFKNKCRSEKM